MNILIIDDEESIREILTDILEDEGYKVFSSEDGESGIRWLDREHIDMCFLDIWMPKLGGIDVLGTIKERFPEVEVVMISGHAKIDQAVRATKMGAYDFLEKPLTIESVLSIVKNIENVKETIKSMPVKIVKYDEMIGGSKKMLDIKHLVASAAKSDARVLIFGENGSGKELVAREVHNQSLRKNKQFISVNCAAIPENLIESELFGHVKGAFTGAIADSAGRFEQADRGTLFLDEVADMSLAMQAKLLRVLQEMKLTRVGGHGVIDVDIRIIAATNKDVKAEIRKGLFREDLYYRLNVIPIQVPPLRERREDIPILIDYFNKKLSQNNNMVPKQFSSDAFKYLSEYNWPGNIRQLRNIVERLLVMSDGGSIGIMDIKKYVEMDNRPEDEANFISKYDDCELNDARIKFERDFIKKKLKENGFNLSQTARALGIFPSNLSVKLMKLGLKVEELRG